MRDTEAAILEKMRQALKERRRLADAKLAAQRKLAELEADVGKVNTLLDELMRELCYLLADR